MSQPEPLRCPEGHLIDEGNLYVTPLSGVHLCRTCQDAWRVEVTLKAVAA